MAIKKYQICEEHSAKFPLNHGNESTYNDYQYGADNEGKSFFIVSLICNTYFLNSVSLHLPSQISFSANIQLSFTHYKLLISFWSKSSTV